MGWTFLAIASCFEVMWAVGLKFTHGFTKVGPSVFTLITVTVSFFFLSQAVRFIPIGTAYAVWTGIGSVGTALFGILLFNEPANVLRILCILLVVAGILGLKLLVTE